MHLQNRVFEINRGNGPAGPVAYWMSRDQRAYDNWALLYAQQKAIEAGKPFVVLFCLVPSFLQAQSGHYSFMCSGLQKLRDTLKLFNIPFVILNGRPDEAIPEFIAKNKISLLVTDFDPLKIKMNWKEKVSRKIAIPFHEVDAHNIVPCRVASSKQEYGAYTIRPKINRLLDDYLVELPKPAFHKYNDEELVTIMSSDMPVNDVPSVYPLQPGEDEAVKTLYKFIENRLEGYADYRNDPTMGYTSHLSPYLHFGMISAQRVALEIVKSDSGYGSKEAFLEELIVRRELADNYCLYNSNYDNFEGIPAWAKDSLNAHRNDRREYLYTIDELENGGTHDRLWNAAQRQMVKTGTMHGYLRMYWAKKILEWSSSPEEAFTAAVYLNDKYELDGRDPNGYAGIAWSLGGVHDRPWFGRNVFGKVRYMSINGLKKKIDIEKYINTNK